jgi:hypothetical protein
MYNRFDVSYNKRLILYQLYGMIVLTQMNVLWGHQRSLIY